MIWTRPDPQQMHQKHPDNWKRKREPETDRSAEVIRILRNINPDAPLKPRKTDQEIWDQVRATWDWSIKKMRQNGVELRTLVEANHGKPSLHDHAVAYERLGFMPTGTCGSVSNLFLQLLLKGGVPTDRVAVAQCTYPHEASPTGTASHAYLILFLNDQWHYLDPNARMSNRTLPPRVTDFQSVGYPDQKGFEYTWPFDTRFAQPHPFHGNLPLVVK